MIELLSITHVIVGSLFFLSLNGLYISIFLMEGDSDDDPMKHGLVVGTIGIISYFWPYFLLATLLISFLYCLGHVLNGIKRFMNQ